MTTLRKGAGALVALAATASVPYLAAACVSTTTSTSSGAPMPSDTSTGPSQPQPEAAPAPAPQSGDVVWAYEIADAIPVGLAPASGGGVFWGGFGEGVRDSSGLYSPFFGAGRLDSSGKAVWEDSSDHPADDECMSVAAGGAGAVMGGVNATAGALSIGGASIPLSNSFVESRSPDGSDAVVAPVGVMSLSGAAAASGGGFFATGQNFMAGERCGGACTQGAIITALDGKGSTLWTLTYASASNLTSPVGWPDGGVSAVLSYPNGTTGPGVSLTGNATTIVKWTTTSTVAWTLTAPSGASFGRLAMTSDGQLVATVHATSAVTIGKLMLDGASNADGLVFVDTNGNAGSGIAWTAPISAIAVGASSDIVIGGWQGCADDASCAGRYVSYLNSGAQKWQLAFQALQAQNSYASVNAVALGSDGQVYVAMEGADLPPNSHGYDFTWLGATGSAYGVVVALKQ
jgi:hypothetical protein